MINIGIGDYGIAKEGEILRTIGLGSCIGVVLYDRASKVCGVAHIMLPNKGDFNKSKNSRKFVDTCLPMMLDDIYSEGGRKGGIVGAVFGGANMFNTKDISIGEANYTAAKELLKKMGVYIKFEDIGGKVGRTVIVDIAKGKVTVKKTSNSLEEYIF